MPVIFKPFDVPMGVGIESKSSPFDTPVGATTVDLNTVFTQTGGRAKRNGFGGFLGTCDSGAQQIVRHVDKLLGIGYSSIFERSDTANKMLATAPFYPSAIQSQIIKTSNYSVQSSDTYVYSSYACTAWVDASGVYVRVFDYQTNTVLSTTKLTALGGVYLLNTAITVVGTVYSGNPIFYVVFGDGSANGNVVLWAGTVTAGVVAWSGPNLMTASIGKILNVTAQVVFGTEYCYLYAVGTTHSFFAKVAHTGIPAASNSLLPSGNTVAGSPAALCRDQTNTFWYVAWTASGGDMWMGKVSDGAALLASASVHGNLQASHATIVARHSGDVLLVYDDATFVGTTMARVWSLVVNSSLTVTTSPAVRLRSCGLVSSAFEFQQGGSGTYQVVFLVSYRSSASNTIAGINFNSTQQNAVTLLYNLDAGAFMGRVFRGQALRQYNTPHVSSSGGYYSFVFGGTALAAADYTTLQSATTFGAAAMVGVSVFPAFTRGISVLQNYFQPAGLPSIYDGSTMTEAGFNVFPECLNLAAGQSLAKGGRFNYGQGVNNTGVSVAVQARANSTQYKIGTMISGFSTGVAASLVWGHCYVCVAAGVSAGASPASWPTDGTTVVDGSCVWQDAGLMPPQHQWATGQHYNIGDIICGTTSGNSIFVVQANNSGGATASPEPSWNTTAGAATISTSGDAYQYLCCGAVTPLTGQGKTYSYAFVYEWADDNGLLWMSSPGPIVNVSTDGTSATQDNVLFVVSTLRVSNKTNARIGVYRTDGNGNVLRKIMLVPNNSAVDAVAIVDTIDDNTGDTGMPLYTSTLGAGELPNVPPPACSTAAIWNQRVVVNDLENPYRIWPSKLINLESIYDSTPAWSDELVIDVDATFGKVQALIQMDDKLIILQDRRISYLTGDGPDNTGGGIGFASPQPIAGDVGCINPNSLVVIPDGLIFQSPKGIYLLDRSLGLQYIGYPLEGAGVGTIASAFTHPTSTLAILVDADNFIAFVYDYFAKQWSWWSIITESDGVISGTTYQNRVVFMDDSISNNILQETPGAYGDWSSTPFGIVFTLGPILLSSDLAFVRVRSAAWQVSASGSPAFRIYVYENGSSNPAYNQLSAQLVADQDSFEIRLINQKMKRVAFRVEETTIGGACCFEAMSLMIGVENGNYRLPAANRTT